MALPAKQCLKIANERHDLAVQAAVQVADYWEQRIDKWLKQNSDGGDYRFDNYSIFSRIGRKPLNWHVLKLLEERYQQAGWVARAYAGSQYWPCILRLIHPASEKSCAER